MRRRKAVLKLDGDRLGLLGGAFFATVVMAMGFFYTELTAFEVVFRTALTFVLVYLVMFVFVRILAVTALPELAARRRAERKARSAPPQSTGENNK